MEQGVSTRELRKLSEAARSISCAATLKKVLQDLVLCSQRALEDDSGACAPPQHVASALETALALALLAYADQAARLTAAQHAEALNALLQLPAPVLVPAVVQQAIAAPSLHATHTGSDASPSDAGATQSPRTRTQVEGQLLDALLRVLSVKCSGEAQAIAVPTSECTSAQVRAHECRVCGCHVGYVARARTPVLVALRRTCHASFQALPTNSLQALFR